MLFQTGIRHDAAVCINTSAVLWHSTCKQEKQSASPKDCLILTGFHGVVSRKVGIGTSIVVTIPYSHNKNVCRKKPTVTSYWTARRLNWTLKQM